ncbi:phytoene desaturase [Roseospira marina]|uniref:Phytoene desaturase n=1 Tax=Roseospira marina TaxID=140057 RepID=A0A5M6IC49_9PROT|nr:1-hydroxycarotenoid 3,4-desaturase CrtD [Roseospira marina]KAA5605537.1 phytoene desaturase [Roseospira marina]MBB4313403.1 1-hydroxycarotenoid 3,4-desaturase [Roseospira marina]MBB5085856.1 1-hydroxycarotenoid 3,4-desaturase [Roseospira marina]
MTDSHAVIVGAGIGGLATAIDLAAQGVRVTVLEASDQPGGKMREVPAGPARMDGGPTVFTMRWVFDELLDRAGAGTLDDLVTLRPLHVLARHAWDGPKAATERFDLFADIRRTEDAIGALSGRAEVERFRDFRAEAEQIYLTLRDTFIRNSQTSMPGLVRRGGVGKMSRIQPFSTLWDALGKHFRDPRLQQLFGRYATYVGGSPFQAPATLMLVAHVELEGVWSVDGGMHALARALAGLAERKGATLSYGRAVSSIDVEGGRARAVRLEDGERITADAVVFNGDVNALALGKLGSAVRSVVPVLPPAARSLSAVTWCLNAETDGFPLTRHTVFFGKNYPGEFHDIFKRRRLPADPTVYICAQDRLDDPNPDAPAPDGPERLLCLVNAPADGDTRSPALDPSEIQACQDRTFALLTRCGLRVTADPANTTVTTPRDFARLFPGTGGGLYGRASHGWQASFSRPGAQTRLPGLYLAGGSVHPGPGVPMAALSGRQAAMSVLKDLTSTSRSRRAATRGGTSTG